MNAETRRRLFEPFFTTKNEGEGSGLGLTTVRNIVTGNGGLINFESESGCGTRAMILLPRALEEADGRQPEATNASAQTSDREVRRIEVTRSKIADLEVQAQENVLEMKKESLL